MKKILKKSVLSLLLLSIIVVSARLDASYRRPRDNKGYLFKRDENPVIEAPLAIPVPDEYIIEAPDTVVIYVQGETGSLLGGSRQVPIKVRPDGRISLPLLGEVYIEGLTPKEASKKVATLLKDYILEPVVSVEVVSFASKKVYITGAVGRQTTVHYTGNQRVLDVIMSAGYLRYGARNYRVRLIRSDPYHPKTYILNISKLLHKGFSKENMYVRPDDILYIEPTVFKWIGEQVSVLLSPITPAFRAGSTVEDMWDLSDRLKDLGD
ncbi:polysaccharide biosynthesis/export family protein [Chlamydiota bacterium]